jgi:transposase-like protein
VVCSPTFIDDLGPFVRGAIEPRRVTALYTDRLDAYRPLARAAGVRHVRRVQGPDRARGVRYLPRSHAMFSNLESWLRGTFHGVSPQHLPHCLDEFVDRFNHWGGELAIGALIAARALRSPPLPYTALVGERS